MKPESRAAALVQALGLSRHPEGGWYAEVFRSAQAVQPLAATPADAAAAAPARRSALTTIDFVIEPGQFSAWHRVRSDEVWHLLEGPGLLLWLLPPDLSRLQCVRLGAVAAEAPGRRPRHVVPAHWWQAAEPLPPTLPDGGDGFAYVGATVGPGFDFADFAFGRDHAELVSALARLDAAALRLL